MTNPNRTDIIAIIDRSGSMTTMAREMDAYLKEKRKKK